ncbi:MAG: hypothetical protein NC832_01970, partial [Candidatus Omnitrophica bacterium]|nr:hypothetical protein [Candidatus Omnitrophota bacterium]
YIYQRIGTGKNIYKINAGISPLNYFSVIKKISPEIIIVVDSVHTTHQPGFILLELLHSIYSSPIDTHSVSLKEFISVLRPPGTWYLLGIQPKSLHNFNQISYTVKKSADKIINFINEKLRT